MSETQTMATLPRRRRVGDAASSGLGAQRPPHLSIRGGQFRLVNVSGVETTGALHMDVIFVDANENSSRIYWDDERGKIDDQPPKCFSDNGIGPSSKSMEPQGTTCALCPKNIRGQTKTFNGFASTFCDSRKKMAFIIPQDTSCTVYEMQVPPGSLGNFNAYIAWVQQQGTSPVHGDALDISDFITRLTFDPEKQFVIAFAATDWADDEGTLKLIEHIHTNNLSVAVCGRDDRAYDPEQVKILLAARAQNAALPAPPQQQQQAERATPGATPPPRPALVQQAPPDQEVIPPPPKGRGRPKAPTQATQQEQTDDGIPPFLKCSDNGAAPRFGIGNPPAPPAGVADALNKAMSLPTRR